MAPRPFAALRLARQEPPQLHLAHLTCQEHPQLHSQLHLAAVPKGSSSARAAVPRTGSRPNAENVVVFIWCGRCTWPRPRRRTVRMPLLALALALTIVLAIVLAKGHRHSISPNRRRWRFNYWRPWKNRLRPARQWRRWSVRRWRFLDRPGHARFRLLGVWNIRSWRSLRHRRRWNGRWRLWKPRVLPCIPEAQYTEYTVPWRNLRKRRRWNGRWRIWMQRVLPGAVELDRVLWISQPW